jgi:hypothetical protein
MVVMIVLAQLYGVLQLAVLGWASRSVRWRVLVFAVLAGVYGAAVIAVVVQIAWTRVYAALTSTSLSEVTDVAAYTVDPFVEEIVKLLPVILVYSLFTSVRRQWGYTDLLLVCAAVGAGFGLAEQLLRFSNDAQNAISNPSGGWTLPGGIFSANTVPGPSGLLTSWLPAGVGTTPLLALNATEAINIHLIWSVVAGLGLALVLRSRSLRTRLIGVAVIALAGLDHAAHNARAGGQVAQAFAEPFTAARQLAWAYPLVVLGIAIWADRQLLERGLQGEPALRLTKEGSDLVTSIGPLTRLATTRLPWSWLVVMGFIRLRRALLYSREDPSSAATGPASGELRHGVDRRLISLNASTGVGGAAVWDHVSAGMRMSYGRQAVRARLADLVAGQGEGGRRRRLLVIVWLLLLVLPIGYFVIGGQPAFGGVQSLYERDGLFWATVATATVSAAWLAWAVLKGARAVPSVRRLSLADPSASAVLLLAMRSGALTLVLVGLFLAVTGTPADGHLLPPSLHILDALGDALLVAGLLLAVLALMAAPPVGLVALAGGGTALAWTGVSAALAGELAVAGAAGSVGILLNEAAGGGTETQVGADPVSPRPRYEASPKHGSTQQGNVAKAPEDGAAALETSVPIKDTSSRRIGVDKVNDEIVVLDETHPGQAVFHGHVRDWSQLRPEMKTALQRANLVDRKGRITP